MLKKALDYGLTDEESVKTMLGTPMLGAVKTMLGTLNA